MIGEYRVVKFFMMVFGNALYSHIHFIDQLTACLHLREVVSEEESDIIIAFVAVSSRAGTDIEAALQGIPQTSRPVVLVVLHHTFDPFFVAPDSRLSVDRNDMLTVDCLFHEDKGLLRCERNQVALKAVTDHLISKGALAWPQEGFKSFLPWRGFTHIIQTRQKIILQVIFGLCLACVLLGLLWTCFVGTCSQETCIMGTCSEGTCLVETCFVVACLVVTCLMGLLVFFVIRFLVYFFCLSRR